MGLVKDDIKFIKHLVKKYGLSKEGQNALHKALKTLKGAGGLVPKAVADTAASVASQGGKYLAKVAKAGKYASKSLGILFMVLTMEGTADAAEIPILTPEDIAYQLGLEECEPCICEKVQCKRIDIKCCGITTWFGVYIRTYYYWRRYRSEKIVKKKKFDVMTRRECQYKCRQIPSSPTVSTRPHPDIRVSTFSYWRSAWHPQ